MRKEGLERTSLYSVLYPRDKAHRGSAQEAKFCWNCGRPDPGRFCPECGTRISDGMPN